MAGLDFLLGESSDEANAARMGLLAAGLGILANNSGHYGAAGPALGAGGLTGLQAYQGAQDAAVQRRYRDAQMADYQRKIDAEKARAAAIADVQARYQQDPNYRPTAGDLLSIDPDTAIKSMLSVGKANEFGLVPQVGINPATGQPAYFIQDKSGNTKWVEAGVPDKLQFVPGSDYAGPQTFNPRTGQLGRVPQAGGAAPGGEAMPAPAPVDPLAPWSKLVSPKEQDQVRARTYEQDSKRLDDLRERVRTGRTVMSDLERFGELNRNTATGGILDRVGVVPTFDEDKREMQAIQARLAPNMRPAGSGTTSDRDLALYLSALPSTDKTGDVNKNIRETYAKQLKAAQDELAFNEKYLTERGHLVGVEDAYLASKKPQHVAPQMPAPPTAAINMLRRNPHLAAQFDAKYGAGSAARAMGR